MRQKVSIIGAGNVGATCAFHLARYENADIVLVDIVDGLPQGKGLDMLQANAITGADALITGSNRFEDTAESDVVVITSGMPRKPGMSRDDLVKTNSDIVRSVTEKAAAFSPDCFIVVVSNPLDAMVHMALHESGFPRSRVFGQSGVLDSARMRTFIARELGVSVRDVYTCVLGGHGDTMVPVIRLCTVGGVPVSELLPPETLQSIVQRTVKGGAEIVGLLKTGSAFYAPGVAAAEIVDCILQDRKKILPCAVRLEGEYDIRDVVVGVPVKIGAAGIEDIIEIKLIEEEKKLLQRSADAVSELKKVMRI